MLTSIYAISSLIRTGFKSSSDANVNTFIKKDVDDTTSHPYIVYGNRNGVKVFEVKISDITYSLPSLLKAMDTFIKAMIVFHRGYPPRGVHVLTFIQQAVFKISTNDDYKNGDLKTLIKEFQDA